MSGFRKIKKRRYVYSVNSARPTSNAPSPLELGSRRFFSFLGILDIVGALDIVRHFHDDIAEWSDAVKIFSFPISDFLFGWLFSLTHMPFPSWLKIYIFLGIIVDISIDSGIFLAAISNLRSEFALRRHRYYAAVSHVFDRSIVYVISTPLLHFFLFAFFSAVFLTLIYMFFSFEIFTWPLSVLSALISWLSLKNRPFVIKHRECTDVSAIYKSGLILRTSVSLTTSTILIMMINYYFIYGS